VLLGGSSFVALFVAVLIELVVVVRRSFAAEIVARNEIRKGASTK
jgi:hypothetical protein